MTNRLYSVSIIKNRRKIIKRTRVYTKRPGTGGVFTRSNPKNHYYLKTNGIYNLPITVGGCRDM